MEPCSTLYLDQAWEEVKPWTDAAKCSVRRIWRESLDGSSGDTSQCLSPLYHWITVINWGNKKSTSNYARRTSCYRKSVQAIVFTTHTTTALLRRIQMQCTDLVGESRTFSRACSVFQQYTLYKRLFTVFFCSFRQMILALLCQCWEQMHSLIISL